MPGMCSIIVLLKLLTSMLPSESTELKAETTHGSLQIYPPYFMSAMWHRQKPGEQDLIQTGCFSGNYAMHEQLQLEKQKLSQQSLENFGRLLNP